jgi:hypothetical protein
MLIRQEDDITGRPDDPIQAVEFLLSDGEKVANSLAMVVKFGSRQYPRRLGRRWIDLITGRRSLPRRGYSAVCTRPFAFYERIDLIQMSGRHWAGHFRTPSTNVQSSDGRQIANNLLQLIDSEK